MNAPAALLVVWGAVAAVVAGAFVWATSAPTGPVLDPDPQCYVAVDNGDGRMLPVRCHP